MKGHNSWIVLSFIILPVILGVVFTRLILYLENPVPEEAELARYPELDPFLIGRTGFRGIRHDLDTGLYSFAFPVTYSDAETYFAEVAQGAVAHGWKLVESSRYQRVFRRKSEAYPTATHFDQIVLYFEESLSEVTLTRENRYPVPAPNKAVQSDAAQPRR